jgi:uncharacterized protein (DUF1330 family)
MTTSKVAHIDHLNVDTLAKLPDEEPVVMLNLMRFRAKALTGQGTGEDAYLRYSALAIKQIKAQGGTIIWTGKPETVALGLAEQNEWDYVALVQYPSRAAFIAMMTSPEYALANAERLSGCAEHIIIAVRETYRKFQPKQEQ